VESLRSKASQKKKRVLVVNAVHLEIGKGIVFDVKPVKDS
jgi:hypothetical protein